MSINGAHDAGGRALSEATHGHTLARMFSPSPRTTLLLLCSISAFLLLAGEHVARREERVRVAADRAPIRALAGEMGNELERLERLYESDLRQVAQVDATSRDLDRQNIWQRSNRIVGVSQWSLIREDAGPGYSDVHIAIDSKRDGRMPEPTFRTDITALPHPRVLLPSGDIVGPENSSWGWIDEPGKPLFFWKSGGLSAVVLLIDPEEVRGVLEPWMAEWSAHTLKPLNGVTTVLLGPDDRRIGEAGPARDGDPDYLVPLHSRFGTWQIAAWDPVVTRVQYDAPTQAAAAVLAVFVAVVGVLAFIQQRSALALAAQRVSFVNQVSHELRTPLTNILLNVDLAGDEAEESPRHARQRLALVQEEAKRLGRLIENVLMYSRAERGKLRVTPRACLPGGVIDGVVEQFAASFTRRGIVVRRSGNGGTACVLDGDALAQIMGNLLSNVEKYVPGGTVEIACTRDKGWLTIIVMDDGPGIAPRDAERVFAAFERLDNRVCEGASGTGLGLAIARELAGKMEGTLRLSPSLHGASFELKVPAADVTELAAVG